MTSTTLSTQPLEATVNGKLIRLQKGDLTALAVDAVVFYARQDLQLGAGFGSAIQSRGGAAIKKELEAIGSVEMGEAAITSAGNMQARHIIHACGPKFREPDTEKKLRKCIQSALEQARVAKLKTVAFPPMGAGFYGVPLDLAARVMLEVVQRFLETQFPEIPSSIEEVIICVMDDRELRAFRPQLEAMQAPGGSPHVPDQSAVAVR
jgi:O-acetyl-ADP-ribose deacetylase (regulator of RNase III)